MNYLPYTEIVNSGATGLTSAVSPEVQFYPTNAEKEHFCQQKWKKKKTIIQLVLNFCLLCVHRILGGKD